MTGHESDRYRRHLLALARRLLRDADRAEDAVQQALLIAVQKDQQEPGLLRWLETTTRYTASVLQRGHRRRERREKKVARPDRDGGDAPKLLDRQWVAESVGTALRSLREPYRTTIIMRFFDGLPPREIARALKVPVTTVDSRLQRGLSQLRTSLGVEDAGLRTRAPKRSLRWLPLGCFARWRPAVAVSAVVMVGVLSSFLFMQSPKNAGAEIVREAGSQPGEERIQTTAMRPVLTSAFSERSTKTPEKVEPPVAAVPADYVLSGRVVSNLGAPCVAAKVTVSHNGSNPRSAYSGADGWFSVGVVREPGIDCLAIQVEHERLGMLQRVWQGPHTGALNLGQLLLNPASCVEVAVHDGGKSVPNAKVRLELRDFGLFVQAARALVGTHLLPVMTNDLGVATWPSLPAGSYRLVAEGPDGERIAEHHFKHDAGQDLRRLEVALEGGLQREIEVLDRLSLQPVAGLELRLQFPEIADSGQELWWADEGYRRLVTDHQGRCVLKGIPPAQRFRVTPARQFEFSNDVFQFHCLEVAGHETFGTLTITAPVRARWPWPQGVEGNTLLAWQFFAGMYYAAPVSVKRQGTELEVLGLDPRARSVMVQVDEHSLIWWDCSRGEATPEPPLVEPARHLDVIVRDAEGARIPDALVRVKQALPWHREWTMTTNKQGVARIIGLSEPEAVIKLTSSAASVGAPPMVKTLAAGEESAKVEFVLQRPLECAIVVHVNGDRRMPSRPLLVKAEGGLRGQLIRDTENSQLRCKVWPYPGELEVRLRVQGPALRDGVVVVPAKVVPEGRVVKAEAFLLDVVNIPLRVTDPTRVAADFQVKRAGGRPSGDWDVSLPWPPRISPEEDGDFLMNWLPPGQYSVMDLKGGRSSTFLVEPHSAPVVVDLDCGVCQPISGRLKGKKSGPYSDSVRVILRSVRTGLRRAMTLNPDGRFCGVNAEWPVVVQVVQLSSDGIERALSNEVLLTKGSESILLEAISTKVATLGSAGR